MLDFTEQEASITSPPASSVDTLIASDNPPDTERFITIDPTLGDPETTIKTIEALAPFMDHVVFTQDEEEPQEV